MSKNFERFSPPPLPSEAFRSKRFSSEKTDEEIEDLTDHAELIEETGDTSGIDAFLDRQEKETEVKPVDSRIPLTGKMDKKTGEKFDESLERILSGTARRPEKNISIRPVGYPSEKEREFDHRKSAKETQLEVQEQIRALKMKIDSFLPPEVKTTPQRFIETKEEENLRRQQEALTKKEKFHVENLGNVNVDVHLNGMELLTKLEQLYGVKINLHGDYEGEIYSVNHRKGKNLEETNPVFKEAVRKLRSELEKSPLILSQKPKSRVGSFFQKVGLALGLVGAAGGAISKAEEARGEAIKKAEITQKAEINKGFAKEAQKRGYGKVRASELSQNSSFVEAGVNAEFPVSLEDKGLASKVLENVPKGDGLVKGVSLDSKFGLSVDIAKINGETHVVLKNKHNDTEKGYLLSRGQFVRENTGIAYKKIQEARNMEEIRFVGARAKSSSKKVMDEATMIDVDNAFEGGSSKINKTKENSERTREIKSPQSAEIELPSTKQTPEKSVSGKKGVSRYADLQDPSTADFRPLKDFPKEFEEPLSEKSKVSKSKFELLPLSLKSKITKGLENIEVAGFKRIVGELGVSGKVFKNVDGRSFTILKDTASGVEESFEVVNGKLLPKSNDFVKRRAILAENEIR